MSKVTTELDFMWEKRLLDYYELLRAEYHYEGLEVLRAVLKLQGLTVEGIDE